MCFHLIHFISDDRLTICLGERHCIANIILGLWYLNYGAGVVSCNNDMRCIFYFVLTWCFWTVDKWIPSIYGLFAQYDAVCVSFTYEILHGIRLDPLLTTVAIRRRWLITRPPLRISLTTQILGSFRIATLRWYTISPICIHNVFPEF